MSETPPAPSGQNTGSEIFRSGGLWTLALLLAFPSTGFIQKYAGLLGVAAYVATVIGIVFLTVHLMRRFAPWLRKHFRSLAILSIASLAAAFVFLHPFEDNRGPGKSSDRDEGLEMAVTRAIHGETPYYPSNRIAGPLSVLPGSIFLASPFVALGNSGYQNVFWLAVFLIAGAAFLQDKAVALWMLTVPLGLSLAAQYEFVSGGDLIANGIFVALFFLLALNTWENPASPAWLLWLTCLLLGLGLASRANFILLLPLFGAWVWKVSGLKNAILAALVVTLCVLAISLPFYLNDPAGFAPLGSGNKLKFADRTLPWASMAMIAATLLASSLAALHLLLRQSQDSKIAFYRCCALVTLTPMICAVLVSTWVNGYLDFRIMKDRFGLMYVFFAVLGWGGALSGDGRTHEATTNGKEI